MSFKYETKIGEHQIIIEAGKLAGQAGGAVTVRSGDTLLLATATASAQPREGLGFFPLTVDYEERLYAAGKIPGGFFKREGRPSEQAILLCRLTDRPLRPLFPKGLRNDVQIIITALSADQENYLDILAIIGASAALTISDIPFAGPVGAVRAGMVDGQLVFNPTATQMQKSLLDLRLAGTGGAVVMVEAGASEVPEEKLLEAIRQGHQAIQPIIEIQEKMQKEIGKPKRDFPMFSIPDEARQGVRQRVEDRVSDIFSTSQSKEERNLALASLQEEIATELGGDYAAEILAAAWEETLRQEVRRMIIDQGIRPDRRRPEEIRPVSCEVGLLPRTHGSGLFNRGETQVLTIATLGTPAEHQILDGLSPEESKRYMHHYNFPPYSAGETRPLRGPSRRDIGHGLLAERSLLPMLPGEDEFPYTIRLVSEVLSSNGSTSMASVSASSLALMDAGVPIRAPVAGIAMGLIQDEGRTAILTDIQGLEDALGDMDFKVAGTRQGITALQMDLKTKGLDYEVMHQALERAREARMFILDKMAEVLPAPRPSLSPYAPRITVIKVDPEKIGLIIGPGGKMIRKIIEETGAEIDIEDDGSVYVSSPDAEASQKAISRIEALVEEPQIGKIYTGRVTKVADFGAFVEILPGRDGLVPISQLADYRVARTEDVVKLGDEIMVMIIDIDSQDKIRLSRQAVLAGWTAEEARARDVRPRPSRPTGSRPPFRGGPPRRSPPRGPRRSP
ncbi:MAG: polyribonucleotide nucleotidyltransferase [Chloroflexi bacterium]|nr:polyribonucleotide nucleotidyltransferase [Chloroflexota bacterium]